MGRHFGRGKKWIGHFLCLIWPWKWLLEWPWKTREGEFLQNRVERPIRPFISVQTTWSESECIQIWIVHSLVKIRVVDCRNEGPDQPLCTRFARRCLTASKSPWPHALQPESAPHCRCHEFTKVTQEIQTPVAPNMHASTHHTTDRSTEKKHAWKVHTLSIMTSTTTANDRSYPPLHASLSPYHWST